MASDCVISRLNLKNPPQPYITYLAVWIANMIMTGTAFTDDCMWWRELNEFCSEANGCLMMHQGRTCMPASLGTFIDTAICGLYSLFGGHWAWSWWYVRPAQTTHCHMCQSDFRSACMGSSQTVIRLFPWTGLYWIPLCASYSHYCAREISWIPPRR